MQRTMAGVIAMVKCLQMEAAKEATAVVEAQRQAQQQQQQQQQAAAVAAAAAAAAAAATADAEKSERIRLEALRQKSCHKQSAVASPEVKRHLAEFVLQVRNNMSPKY